MTKLADLASQALTLATERAQALADAHRHDPDLTDEANAERAAEQVRLVTAKYAALLADLRTTAAEAAADAKAAADRLHVFDPTDVAALVRSEQSWTHVVKPALERGETITQALAAADADAVAGAKRFAPAWVTGRYGADADVSGVDLAASHRLAELDPAHADTILSGASATADLSTFGAVLDAVERGDRMSATIAAKNGFEAAAPSATDEGRPSGRDFAASIGARYADV